MRQLRTSFQTADIVAHAVLDFELEEALGVPARATVNLHFNEYVDPDALLGAIGTLRFGHEVLEHSFAGVVTAATCVATTKAGSENIWPVRVEVASQLAILEHSVTSRIFQDLTVPDIVGAVLSEHGVPEGRQQWNLSASYPKREYCVQYAESALAFVSRLLEKEGIWFFSAADDEGELIVFADDNAAAKPIEGDARLPYVTASGLIREKDAFMALADRHRVVTGAITLRDYDFKRPSLDLTANAESDVDADLELYDYPAGYVEPADGKRLARVRLEAAQAERHTLSIVASCARLKAGHKVTLAETPRELDGEYLITKVKHRHSALHEEAVLGVTVELLADKVPFRTPLRTPWPIVEGPHTAMVVAPDKSEPEEIHTDEHGRCKVKFHWDLDKALDDRASCWIRTTQPQTSGSMVLPRVDWEVVVEFQQGDPDRPIVTGRVYNDRFMPPYKLPEGKTRTAIQTASSPGGAGRSEIRFEDKAGSEEVSIKAQKNQTLNTGDCKKKSVGNNEKQSVVSNRTLIIGGNQSIKVTGGFKETVASRSLTVGGNRSVGVNAVLGQSVGGASTTSVGGNQFEMDGNPFEGLLMLAIEKGKEAAEEKAAEAMKKLDAAVKDKIDQVMKPINEVREKAEAAGKAIEAAKNGDPIAAMDAASKVAGVPGPTDVGKKLKESVTPKEGTIEKHLFDEAQGKEETATKGNGKPEEPKEEAPKEQSMLDKLSDEKFSASKETGLDKVVEGAIDDAAGGLSKALGLPSAGGGGASEENLFGPDGSVNPNAAADSEGGPGHQVHKTTSSYSETIGSLRASIAAGNINTNMSGSRTQTIGAARIELVGGTRAESVGANKTEKAIGMVVLSSADEGEDVGGNKMLQIGGAEIDLVGSDQKVAAGAKAGLVGALIKVDAKSKITFTCGASEVVVDGSGVTIKSPKVGLTAGSIKLTKTVAEGPGGGAGGGGGAGPGGATGGGGGGPGAGEGGAGGGGGGGGASGGSGDAPDKDGARGAADDQGKGKGKGKKGDPGELNDDDKELNDKRRKAREETMNGALDNARVNDEKTGKPRPLTDKEKQDVRDMHDLDQPLVGDPETGWFSGHTKPGKGHPDDKEGKPWQTRIPGEDSDANRQAQIDKGKKQYDDGKKALPPGMQ